MWEEKKKSKIEKDRVILAQEQMFSYGSTSSRFRSVDVARNKVKVWWKRRARAARGRAKKGVAATQRTKMDATMRQFMST